MLLSYAHLFEVHFDSQNIASQIIAHNKQGSVMQYKFPQGASQCHHEYSQHDLSADHAGDRKSQFVNFKLTFYRAIH